NGKVRGFFVGIALAGLANIHPAKVPPEDKALVQPAPSSKPDIYVETYVTGYNTVPGQTDATPCIAASGANICGRRDAIACPPLLPLGAIVEIKGKKYVCEDRRSPRRHAQRLVPPSTLHGHRSGKPDGSGSPSRCRQTIQSLPPCSALPL